MVSVNEIIAYESGEMTEIQMIRFFAKLIKTGMAWTLQGHYGRTASSLIECDVLDKKGNILIDLDSMPE